MGKGMIDIAPPFSPPNGSFQKDLEDLINRHSIEGGSNTPDFILAEYLRCCLDSFDMVTRRRDDWYKPGEHKKRLPGHCQYYQDSCGIFDKGKCLMGGEFCEYRSEIGMNTL